MTYYTLFQPQTADEGYGITVIDIRVVRDISPHYKVVRRLVDKFNSIELSSVHFDDVLENFLSDCETF